MRVAACAQTQHGGLKLAIVARDVLELAFLGGEADGVEPALFGGGAGGEEALQVFRHHGVKEDRLFAAEVFRRCKYAEHARPDVLSETGFL